MTKLKSFGCSFIYGSELSGTTPYSIDDPSNLTWPALIAKKLNVEHQCYALPGQGNFKIYCDILANSYYNDDSQEHWQTLKPAQENEIQDFYYRNLHSQLKDMIANASWIVSAAEHLTSLGCPFVMTYMDHNLLTPINPNWHDPRYLEILQQKLSKVLVNFEGMNFLDWSRKKLYPVSATWHPLEAAHQAAADYWLPHVQSLV